jgi:hypothetical protein
MSNEKDEALVEIAEALERLDNLTAALGMTLDPAIHVAGLREALPEVKAEIKAAYLKLGGVDHWATHPGA